MDGTFVPYFILLSSLGASLFGISKISKEKHYRLFGLDQNRMNITTHPVSMKIILFTVVLSSFLNECRSVHVEQTNDISRNHYEEAAPPVPGTGLPSTVSLHRYPMPRRKEHNYFDVLDDENPAAVFRILPPDEKRERLSAFV